MTSQHQLVEGIWNRLGNAALLTGMSMGVFLSCTLIAWLRIANHFPQWYGYAAVRNISAGGLTILAMAIPAFCFRRQPAQLLVSGLTAWIVLTATYLLTELRYSLLESRMGAFQFFMLGAISLGFIAVLDWVFLICVKARHRHFAQVGQRPIPAARHRMP